MDYKLEFESRAGYLYVYVEAYKITYEAMREYCSKIGEAVQATPERRMLVERAAGKQLSTTDAFRLAAELPELGFARTKFAFVDHTENNDDLNEFTETVGNNRGLNARTFKTVEAAENWLMSG
ncbi:hypothetical protein BH10ACI2_BH10ACI2_09980 [soil metagenome]